MKIQKLVIKSVTFVLFGLLIASFAVWGIGDIFRGTARTDAVAEVGDTRIEQQDFARALSRELNRLSNRLGQRFDVEQARALGVVDQVITQMVGRALYEQKAADLKLVVTDDVLKQRITEEPAFRNSLGQFDRGRFVQTLQLSNLSEQEYLQSLRQDIIRQQIVDALTSAAAAPRELASVLYAYRAEQRVARILRVPNASIQDLPEPDEASLDAFHKEFSSSFMAPESRALSLVQLRVEDLAGEIAVSDEQLQEEFEAQREDFVTPERRRVEQIVLPDEAAAQDAVSRLRDAGEFSAVARDVTGLGPIALGLVEVEDLPGELADAAFSLSEGEVSESVESALGWHIVRVTEIQPRHEPGLDEVRDRLKQDIAMRQATDSMISIANQLDDELAAGATLEEAAGNLDLSLRRIGSIDRNGRDSAGQDIEILARDRVIEAGFDTPAGETSLLTETDEGGYFIVRVDGVTPAQLRPLAEVRDQVVELWRDSRRAERAREVAEGLAERVRVGQTLDALAETEGYEVTTSEPLSRFASDSAGGVPPTLPGKLFGIAPGEITTVNAADAHLVVQLEEVRQADPAADATEVATLRESLENVMRNDLLEQFAQALQGEYGAEINQIVVDNILASF